jgi:hypothetical protein
LISADAVERRRRKINDVIMVTINANNLHIIRHRTTCPNVVFSGVCCSGSH